MKTIQTPPDPIRVMIVVDVARCSVESAERTIEALDKYDSDQRSTTPNINNKTGGASAMLPSMLRLGRSSLELAGCDRTEATKILQALFTGFAAEYGGKSLYLPKLTAMKKKLKHL